MAARKKKSVTASQADSGKSEAPVKRRVGRPSKYEPEFCEMLIEHMSKGHSFDSFVGVLYRHGLDVVTQTLYNWRNDFPDFLDAARRGETLGLETLEGLGLELGQGLRPQGKTAAWKFFMQNRYGWRERTDAVATTTTVVATNAPTAERTKKLMQTEQGRAALDALAKAEEELPK